MPEPSSHPARYQFSLRTILLVILIAALALGLWRSYLLTASLRAELVQVRSDTERELERWRAEVGALTVKDETRLHAIQVETLADLSWKWRVFVPKGCRFIVGSRWSRIPRDEIPGAAGPVLDPGEHVVLMVVRKNVRNQWECRITVPSGGVKNSIETDDAAWLEQHRSGCVTTGVGRAVVVAPDNRQLVLLRHRVFDCPGSPIFPPNPEPTFTEGVMVWLQDANPHPPE